MKRNHTNTIKFGKMVDIHDAFNWMELTFKSSSFMIEYKNNLKIVAKPLTVVWKEALNLNLKATKISRKVGFTVWPIVNRK